MTVVTDPVSRPAAPRAEGITGSVHSWDISTGVDGPGTRLVFFLAGCPLRCLYCANPDTWLRGRGRPATAADLLRRVDRYQRVLTVGRGGVTLSGGEPLLQRDFAAVVLHGVRERGMHTALDTSGFLGHRATDAMLADIDLVLLDIKSFDPELYRRLTGKPLAPTLRFAERLAAQRRPVWVRFVVVPGLTDEPGSVAGLARFTAGLGNVQRVDVLAYHRLGEPKYQALGIEYPLRGIPAATEEQVARVRQVFADQGLAVS